MGHLFFLSSWRVFKSVLDVFPLPTSSLKTTTPVKSELKKPTHAILLHSCPGPFPSKICTEEWKLPFPSWKNDGEIQGSHVFIQHTSSPGSTEGTEGEATQVWKYFWESLQNILLENLNANKKNWQWPGRSFFRRNHPRVLHVRKRTTIEYKKRTHLNSAYPEWD